MVTSTPSSGTLPSFKDVLKPIGIFHQLLGVSPSFKDTSRKLSIITNVAYFVLILFYWIGVGFAFAREGLPNNTISVVSNSIQLLLNSIALTVATVNPMWNYQSYSKIISCFFKIDNQLQEIGQDMAYKEQGRLLYGMTAAFFSVLIYNSGFDLYVSVIRYGTALPYWILCSVPLFIHATSLHQAILFIFCVHKRLQLVGKLLKPKKSSFSTRHKRNKNLIQILDISYCSCPEQKYNFCAGKCLERENTTKVLQIVNDIYWLCKRINDYFGPGLLSSLAALFAVTAVQSFHSFVVASDLDEAKRRSTWSLTSCINLIVINVLLVFGLCWACEKVSADIEGILSSVIHKQQTEKSFVNEFNWLHPMLTRIKFSALGFFNINYNMLFGFTTAIITYLIILVQFNSQTKEPRAESHNQGSDRKPLEFLPGIVPDNNYII